ncbi:hypothetical protein GCM10023210_31420 [Chryseobacterium ginsengisoli]|uniref:Uncharacterized protein n=1 Tax=Chryseobacterium ginsengisoli TaxID=363853 RepID=A0ABP9MLT8_9FLAO
MPINNTDTVPLNTIQSWFQTGDYPTQEQFQKSWASLWHKFDKLPISSVENLETSLQNKLDKEVYANAIKNLANVDASNIDVQQWKDKLEVMSLPENMATIDNPSNGVDGNVFTKEYIEENYMPFFVDQAKRTINSESNLSDTVMHDAVISGWNVLPNYVGKDEGDSGYSSRYVIHGTDIFQDFTGDTNYRPGHPAHDSLVAYGSLIAKGFNDGTNFTFFGTGLFAGNDIQIADSVTAVGKGINNAKAPHNDPNRVAIASNGFNLRSPMMSNVVATGNEIWCGDVHSSVITGYNVRNFRYIFNSLVLGGNIFDKAGQDNYLDNDVLIGFGFSKNLQRHGTSHNLLIGAHEHYGNGSPDPNYRPLVEGNFRNKYFGVNGVIRNQITDELNKVPTENIELSLTSSPANSNATYDPATKKLILNNSPAGNYRVYFGLTVGESYLFSIHSNLGSTGTWGYSIGASSDSGNPDSWLGTNNNLVEITSISNNYFDIVLDGSAITGDVTVSLLHVKNNENQIPVQEVRDFAGNVTLEVRTGNNLDNHVSIGKNTAGKYASGTYNFIAGTDSLTKANSINTTTLFGNSNLQKAKVTRLNQIFGHSNLQNTLTAHRVVAVGQNIASNGLNLSSSTILGNGALGQFVGNYVDTNNWNEITAVGSGSALLVKESRTSVFVGSANGWCENVFDGVIIGNRAKFKDGVNSNNETVIGANAIGNGNNTTTLGNTAVQSVYLSDIIKVDRSTGVSSQTVFNPTNDGDFIQKKHLDNSKPYKVYTGNIQLTGSPALPVFPIFENTVGAIIWERVGTGSYNGTLLGAFPVGKVWSVSKINATDGGAPKQVLGNRIDDNTFNIKIVNAVNGSAYETAGELGAFEIRIYK